MKILELITELKKVEQEYGNIDVEIDVKNEQIGPSSVFESDGYCVISDEEVGAKEREYERSY